MFVYKTEGTCSREIIIDVDENDKLRSVRFVGGCAGNTQGVAKLCIGRDISEVASLLKGTLCRNGTSCPDQLARAIEAYKQSKK